MSSKAKHAVPFAQQQLTQAIAQLKQGVARDQILPMLEQVLAQLQILSTHDHLTGALNRRSLIASLEAELKRSLRTGHTFTFAVISIDHLPELMDQHGQDATKRVLQVVTQEASAILRTLDSFGRIAATDFAIVMPTTWLDQSQKAIHRLQQRFAAVDWDDISPGINISVSTGLTANSPGDTAELMLTRATTALTEARLKGPGGIAQVETDLPGFDPAAAA